MPLTLDGSAGMTAPQGAIYNGLQKATAVGASGTSIDFTNIPSWVQRVTVMFNSVSTNGTSALQLQLGTSSGVVTSGYVGAVDSFQSTPGGISRTTGLGITRTTSASDSLSGVATIVLISGNTWVGQGNASSGASQSPWTGAIALAATLDRVRITTVNGTDTFDAGTINIMYE